MKIFKTLIAGLFLFTATGMLHLFTGSGLVHAQNRYVAPDGTNSGNCSAGSSPCATIVYALNWSEQGDVIHVQAGTYTETLFIGKNVTIRGAGAGETIIQAHAVRGFATSRVVHVGESATSARIEDVTIRHGNDPVAGSVGGGGIFVQGTLAVVNASVESNNAAGTGGGLSGETTSRITLTNTAVSGNAAGGDGGGIFSSGVVIIRENSLVVDNNSGNNGGGLYLSGSGSVEQSYIFSNNAQSGGGINHAFGAGFLEITRSVIDDNSSTNAGAGIFTMAPLQCSESRITNNVNFGSGGGGILVANQATVINTVISGNRSSGPGGGIYVETGTLHLTGSLVSGNKAANGAGLYLDAAQAALTNVTITGNDATHNGGGLFNTNDTSPDITNVVFWGNRAGSNGNQIQNQTPGLNLPQITHSLIQGSMSGGSWSVSLGSNLGGNIDQDPEFTAPQPVSAAPTANGTYTTSRNSPVVNAGQTPADLSIFPGGPDEAVDLAGNPRVDGAAIDMGAYEVRGDPLPPGAFVTTWKTDNPGTSADNQITIPIIGTGYNFNVSWGDGTSGSWDSGDPIGDLTHTYPEPGVYTVTITGTFPRIHFNDGGDKEKILTVEQWGDIGWTSMENAFYGTANLQVNAEDAPDLSSVASLRNMFRRSEILNADFDHWDVSAVTDMEGLFAFALAFDGDITSWNVSNVTNMRNMFAAARVFNRDIGYDPVSGEGWDVSSVTEMSGMFTGTHAFNHDIGGWDVSSVRRMVNMFFNALAFNQDIGNWKLESLEQMESMFAGAVSFNQDLNNWDVSRVQNFFQLFGGASAFNGDISNWNMSNARNTSWMFRYAESFNQDINTKTVNAGTPDEYTAWDVSGVTDMWIMFIGAASFNRPLDRWNTGNVVNMERIFDEASVFDQDLGMWDIGNVVNMTEMFNESGLSRWNYDRILTGWAAQTVQPDVPLGAAGLVYCAADARQILTTPPNNWTIDDAGPADDCGLPDIENMRILASNRSGFVFRDTELNPVFSVEITSLPHMGQLLLDGTPVAAGTQIPVPDIDSGMLVWSYASDEHGYNYSSFTAQIVDDAGEKSDPFTVHIDLGEARVVLGYDGEGWRQLGSAAFGETFGSLLAPVYTMGIPGSNDPGAAWPNLYRADHPGSSWAVPGTMADEIGIGEAFAIYVYSDDNNDGTPNGFPKTLIAGENWPELNGMYTYPGIGHDPVAGTLHPVNSYMLANPHPVSLSYCAMIGDPASGGVSYTIDIWDPSANGGFGGYGVTGCIPPIGLDHAVSPYEAFWVRTLQPDPALNIPEAAYLKTMGSPLFKINSRNAVADDHTHAFTLDVQSADGIFSSSMQFILSNEGTYGNDLYDAPKRSAAGFAEKWLAFFAANENGIGYSVRSLPVSFDNQMHVPLDVLTTEAGEFVMSGNFPDGDRFRYFLRDNDSGEIVELDNGKTYGFSVADRPFNGPAFPESLTDLHRSDPVAGPRFELMLTRGDAVGLDELARLPDRVSLVQNYPNPFNPSTTIRYELPEAVPVRLDVFDIAGRLVSTLVDAQMPAGRHQIRFDAPNLASGVYIYRLSAGNVVQSRKLTLIK